MPEHATTRSSPDGACTHLVLTGWRPEAAVALFSGARVIEVSSTTDVAQAVELAASGRQVVAVAPVSGVVVDLLAAELRRLGTIRLVRAPEDLPSGDDALLRPDEDALLSLLAQGLPLGAAAAALHMSRRTADRRLARARGVLGVATTTEAVTAFRSGRVPGSSAGPGLPAPVGLVGREAEVASLTEVLTAQAGGALVVADAAVGKSALLRATVESGGFRALSGGGQLTMALQRYWPLRRALGGLELTGDPEAVASLVASVVGPHLLVIDDVHLADPDTVDVLGALAGRISVLAAARPDPPGVGNGPVSRLRDAGLVVLDLPTLSDPDIARLARLMAPELPPDRIERIVAGAGGLPLMVEFLSGMDPDAPIGRGLLPVVEDLRPEEFDLALRLALASRPLPGGEMATALVAHGVAAPAGEGQIRIRHALVADAVVAVADESAVTAAHRHLAAEAQDDAVAAQHWHAAGDLRRASGCAAAAARKSTSLVDSARLLRLVAQCSTDGDGSAAWLCAASALSDAGMHEEALSATELVHTSLLNAEQRALTTLIRTRALWHRGETAAALACVADGVAAAGPGTREEAVLTLERIRCESMSTGVRDEHRRELARVEAIIGDGPHRAALLNVAGLVAYHGGGEGRQEWTDGLAAGDALGDTDSLMRCGNNLIAWHESCGDQEEGLALAFRMSERAGALGLGEWQAQFGAMAANLLYHRGRYPEALELAERVEEQALDRRTLSQARLCRVATLIDLGLLDSADQLLPGVAERGSPDWMADNTVVYLRACWDANAGRTREALAQLERFDDDLAYAEFDWFFARSVRAWVEFDLSLPVTPADRVPSLPILHGLLLEIRAVGMLETDPLGAAELFTSAARAGQDWSVGVGLRAAWGAAEALRRAGRPDAVDALLAVESQVMALGLDPLLTRVRRSLRKTGVRRSAPRALDRSGLLTAREREVLDLVAAGASYEQVARRLGVGRPTVRRLIGNARLKLGADTRLAAIAALPPRDDDGTPIAAHEAP